jgi:hypothetical protein
MMKGKTSVLELVIPALWRLRQEDLEFEANLGYIVRCLKKLPPPNFYPGRGCKIHLVVQLVNAVNHRVGQHSS